MPNDHRTVDIEFLGNFSCSCKRVSFDDYSQLAVNFHWLPTTLLLFKALISFTKLLESPLPFIFISSSTALYIHYHSLSSVQSLSCVRLFATPRTAAHQASLSIINSWSSLAGAKCIADVVSCLHCFITNFELE